MQKPIFSSKEQEALISQSLGSFKRICFILSTVSSAYCMYMAGMAMISEYTTSIWAHGIIAAISLYVCYLIDFFGVSRFGTHVAGEIVAICSREFYTPTMKKLFTMFSFMMFAACFLISFYTSRDGSKLVGALAKSDNTAQKTVSMIDDADDKMKKRLSVYETKIEKLEAEAEKAAQSAGNGELRRLAKDGNSWAADQIKIAQEGAKASYQKQITALKAEMEKVKKEELSTASLKFKAIEADAEIKIDAQKSKSNALMVLLQLLGVWPLFIAVILMSLDAIGRVQRQIPYSSKQQGKGWMETFRAFTSGK